MPTPAALHVALVTEVFCDDPDGAALSRVLTDAKERGAEVAVLPELPLNGWAPASKIAQDADAEEPDGPRQTAMSAAAASVGIALVGGAIVTDPATGAR
jgi:predicted amidohydrolase